MFGTVSRGTPAEHQCTDAWSQNRVIILLQTKVKIDGSGDKKHLAPINLLLHSLFSLVAVSLNIQCITSPKDTYAYKSYIETLLNLSKEGKKSKLTSELNYKDMAGHMDKLDCTEVVGN